MSYRKALTLLEAYVPRSLAQGADDVPLGEYCAVVAIGSAAGLDLLDISFGTVEEVSGMTREETEGLVVENDAGGPLHETDAARYVRVLGWLRARVAWEPS